MLLVDDDEAEVVEGQIQGRAGADDEPRAARPRHAPAAAALGHGEARVPFGRAGAEAGVHALDELRRERDLGQKDERLAAHPQALGHGLQVHLGLARAGDALQERGAVGAAGDLSAQVARGLGLLARKGRPGAARVELGIGRVARRVGLPHRAGGDQAAHHAGGDAGGVRQLLEAEGLAVCLLQRLDHAGAGVGHPVRPAVAAQVDAPHRRRIAQARRAGGEAQHQRHRRHGVGAALLQKRAHLGAHGLGIQDANRGAQLLGRKIPHPGPPNDAEDAARPQRHLQKVAEPAAAFGRAVVERAAQGLRRHHGDALAGREARHGAARAGALEGARSQEATMKFFLDTADTQAIRELADLGMVDGVTTNPSLILKAGRDIAEVTREICEITPGPVSAEVVALEADDMIAEGRHLAQIADNIAVKVPLTWAGLRACRTLADEGRMVNVTLCFSAAQAILAAKAGATFVSPFIGRLDDINLDGMELIRDIRQIYDNYDFKTQILAASIRTVGHMTEAAVAGADVATAPPDVIRKMAMHPLTDKGLESFLADWKKTGQRIG